MKLKKLLLQLSLLLSFMGLSGMTIVTANAAGTPLTDAAGTGVIEKTANFVDDNSNDFGSSGYPTLEAVSADGVVNGRVTKNTKHIYVSYSGAATMSVSNRGKYLSAHADVTVVENGKARSLATSTPTGWKVSSDYSTSTATAPSGATDIPVDLSELGSNPKFPIYIGFTYRATGFGETATDYYGQLTLNGNNATTKTWAPVVIGTNNQVSSSDLTVSGTGQPGLSATLTGLTGDYEKTTTIDSDGKYSFSLKGSSIADLGNPSSIQVVESNEFGDSLSATATVSSTVPLTITSGTPSLTVSPDDWDAHIAGKSSSEIATWIASQTGMTATKPDGTTSETLAYDTTDGDSLKATVAGGTQAVTMNVSDADGNASTTPATISVTRGAGKLQFGDMTNMVFGNGATLPVPGQKTLYAPGDYQINISDTREMGSAWYVTANATPMTATDGSNRTLSGHIVYEDGNGTRTQLDSGNAVPVASGKRDSNSTDIAKSWNQDGKSYDGSSVPAGVYLDANPNIYAAGGATGYSGNITWSLTDAPGN